MRNPNSVLYIDYGNQTALAGKQALRAHCGDGRCNTARSHSGSFCIATTPEFATTVVGPIAGHFSVEYPDLTLRVGIAPVDQFEDKNFDTVCIIYSNDNWLLKFRPAEAADSAIRPIFSLRRLSRVKRAAAAH